MWLPPDGKYLNKQITVKGGCLYLTEAPVFKDGDKYVLRFNVWAGFEKANVYCYLKPNSVAKAAELSNEAEKIWQAVVRGSCQGRKEKAGVEEGYIVVLTDCEILWVGPQAGSGKR